MIIHLQVCNDPIPLISLTHSCIRVVTRCILHAIMHATLSRAQYMCSTKYHAAVLNERHGAHGAQSMCSTMLQVPVTQYVCEIL